MQSIQLPIIPYYATVCFVILEIVLFSKLPWVGVEELNRNRKFLTSIEKYSNAEP